ncbi:MAG: UDP-N-acetylglucosamine 2-epimerase [Thalassobaculales bacterium]
MTAGAPGDFRLLAVTGARADWGLLRWPLLALAGEPGFTVEVAVTGMHLAPLFGSTVAEVEAAGLPVVERVETLLAGDSGVAMAKAVALGILGFADALARRRPDGLLLLGDRFEVFAAAQAAFLQRIPIIHLCGGDLTDGALDDAMRHAISHMAALHLPSTAVAARRLSRLGADPARIVVVGSPGLDILTRGRLPDRAAVEQALGFSLRRRNLLVTFHPATREGEPLAQLACLLEALDALGPEVGLIITQPNADAGGRAIAEALARFAEEREHAILRASLGQTLYLGVMAQVDAVVGNSSSGLYEAPSLAKPTVNIGSRQDGRLKAASVIDCPAEAPAIVAAIGRALALDCSGVENPYGDGHASERIVAALRRFREPGALAPLPFHDG